MGRSVEWLELRWAKHSKKCSLVRLQIRWEGGEWDRCWFHGGKQKTHFTFLTCQGGIWKYSRFMTKIRRFLRIKKMANESNASLIAVSSVVLVSHFATPLSTSETDLQYLWTHSACRTITTLSEWGPSIGSGCSQSECRKWVTGKPLHLSALTWYFTWLSSDPASHYLSNTIYNWDALCPVSSSSQGAPLCSAPLRQRRGVMAVANFHYITRMSSGFKVYILEGKLCYRSSLIDRCYLMTVDTVINLIRETEPLLWLSYNVLLLSVLMFRCKIMLQPHMIYILHLPLFCTWYLFHRCSC